MHRLGTRSSACSLGKIAHSCQHRAVSRTPSSSLSSFFAIALLCACGGGDGNGGDPGNNPDGAPGSSADASPGGGADANTDGLVWTPLITGDWSLPAGGENTNDRHTLTLDRDIYVGAIRPIEPTGTHHTVLDNGGAGIIYASGVGTNEVVFPPGVGLKLSAGTTLSLQLHVFNPSGSALAGTSGVEIVEVPEAEVEQVADLFLPGPFAFQVGPMQQTVHTGTCVVQQSQNIFALFPHMHQLGTHFKTTITKGGVSTVLHDADYDFNEQSFTSFEPISLSPGDSITSECTWVNPNGQTVIWGESSTSEMCFSILYRYPAIGGSEFCDNGFTP